MEMKAKDRPKSRFKILEAAEKLFSEKGFDAARVDDIAERAGVNKALIYYYFKSKRDVLEELFDNFIQELVEVVYDSFKRHTGTELVEDMAQELEVYYNFMESKEDTIRIMMMESMKASEEPPPLFKLSEITTGQPAQEIIEMLKERGLHTDVDIDEAAIADFFTGMIPMISFIVYRDKWSEHFNIDMEELKKKFFNAFRITHLAYHKMQQTEME